jgi:hypothetical protein
MSWTPTLNLKGPPTKTGLETISGSGEKTITFASPFPDNNYVIILTPYGQPTGIPIYWVVTTTSSGFTISTSGIPQISWVAIYGSNP